MFAWLPAIKLVCRQLHSTRAVRARFTNNPPLGLEHFSRTFLHATDSYRARLARAQRLNDSGVWRGIADVATYILIG